MPVEAHDDFCVAVVEGDCVYLDQDLVLGWGRLGRRGQCEVVEAVEAGGPLFDRVGHGGGGDVMFRPVGQRAQMGDSLMELKG